MNAATTAKRPRVPTEQRRIEILETAKQVFAEYGYQVADVQTIADRAGVGKGTVYRHFPTKEVLFKQTLTRQLDILRQRMHDARASEQQPLRQLKAVMAAYFQFFDEMPEIIELFVHERAEFGHKEIPLYFARMDEQCALWTPLFADLKTAIPSCTMAVDDVMLQFGEFLHGTVYLCKAVVPKRLAIDRLEAVYRAFIQSLVASPETDHLYQQNNL